MRKLLMLAALAAFGTAASAQTPAVLLEACNAMEPASKRLECLRAATGLRSDSGQISSAGSRPQSAYAMPQPSEPGAYAPAARVAPRNSGDKTCYTGPRGGTYTITASGGKNYSGC